MKNLHFRKDGKLDMRYKTSKQAVAMGLFPNPNAGKAQTPRRTAQRPATSFQAQNFANQQRQQQLELQRQRQLAEQQRQQQLEIQRQRKIAEQQRQQQLEIQKQRKIAEQQRQQQQEIQRQKQIAEQQRQKAERERKKEYEAQKRRAEERVKRSQEIIMQKNIQARKQALENAKRKRYTDSDIVLNQDLSINKNSSAVKRGEITFNADNTIDRNCLAVKSGKLVLTASGEIDNNIMQLSKRSNPMDLPTSAIRDPYEQQKLRQRTKSVCLEKKQASHVFGCYPELQLLSNKRGTHLTEEKLKEALKPLTDQMRMKSRESNQILDKKNENLIVRHHRGESVPITRSYTHYLDVVANAFDKVDPKDWNPTINHLHNEVIKLQKEAHEAIKD